MKIKQAILAILPFMFFGCVIYNPERSEINTYFHEDLHKAKATMYSDKKMTNPVNAVVLETDNKGLNPTVLETLTYETSLLAFGVLQTIDPNFSLESVPMQYIKLQTDTNKSDIIYIILASNPYTFRKDDNVTIDVNASKIISIRPSHINPNNMDMNDSNKSK